MESKGEDAEAGATASVERNDATVAKASRPPAKPGTGRSGADGGKRPTERPCSAAMRKALR